MDGDFRRVTKRKNTRARNNRRPWIQLIRNRKYYLELQVLQALQVLQVLHVPQEHLTLEDAAAAHPAACDAVLASADRLQLLLA